MSKKASVNNNIKKQERREKDFYPTPMEAVVPLIPHLDCCSMFFEPCAGNGALIKHIEELTEGNIFCVDACDIDPQPSDWVFEIEQRNALSLKFEDVADSDYIITNPPFLWSMLQPLLDHLPTLRPTWLLLPFAYACNKRMAPYMKVCKKVVPIGRVKWIEGSTSSGTDDFAWFLFDLDNKAPTKLYPRN